MSLTRNPVTATPKKASRPRLRVYTAYFCADGTAVPWRTHGSQSAAVNEAVRAQREGYPVRVFEGAPPWASSMAACDRPPR